MESTVCAPHVPQTVQGVWQELDEYVSMVRACFEMQSSVLTRA